jgi:hypothetical protein
VTTPSATLRIVRGEPSPEELAVVLALVTARGAAGGEAPQPDPPVRGRWNDPAHGVRRSLRHGPGGWASSATLG